MTLKETFKELEELRNENTYAYNFKNGVGENQFGVKLGDIRKVAKKAKKDHKLALELWNTNNFDAQMLSILIINPKELSKDELDLMVRSVKYTRVADWLNAYVVKVHPDNETLRLKWMKDKNPMAARTAWNLTSINVSKIPEILDFSQLLDRIEQEMSTANEDVKWTMNFTLAEIGINHAEYRNRAIAIGEKLGVYRHYPVSKGCTSPFAPIWIKEIVSRQV